MPLGNADMQSINPATGEFIHEFSSYSHEMCAVIFDAVHAAYRVWRAVPLPERARFLRHLAEALLARKDEFATLITQEMGKLLREALLEVEKSAWICDYYADHAATMLIEESIPTYGRDNLVVFEPLGPILAVMPWNFPFWQVFRHAAPSLIAGNGLLLKHASNVCGVALALEALFRDQGFPSDLVRILLVPGSCMESLIGHPAVAGVTFTGSCQAGASVAAAAGRYLKKSVLELGGSDPCIILEDADLDAAAGAVLAARMTNAGQTCVSPKRLIVVEAVARGFVERLAAGLSRFQPGDPMNLATTLAPMARKDLVDVIHRQVQTSVAAGATLVVGGNRLVRPGDCFYLATLLTDVHKGMPAYDEELFGPVVVVVTVRDVEEAVAVANDTPFGLGGVIWTGDKARGLALARRIDAGTVAVGGHTSSHPQLPFGGIKQSGWGRELSTYGIKEFVNIKTIALYQPE
ncbi:putative succinate-semialdehyde dehydrogenase (NADP(+)) [Desulfovibrionales bacterium]